MSSNTERKNGYYWVKDFTGWRVGDFGTDGWYLSGDYFAKEDDYFEEIDETPITRKEINWIPASEI